MAIVYLCLMNLYKNIFYNLSACTIFSYFSSIYLTFTLHIYHSTIKTLHLSSLFYRTDRACLTKGCMPSHSRPSSYTFVTDFKSYVFVDLLDKIISMCALTHILILQIGTFTDFNYIQNLTLPDCHGSIILSLRKPDNKTILLYTYNCKPQSRYFHQLIKRSHSLFLPKGTTIRLLYRSGWKLVYSKPADVSPAVCTRYRNTPTLNIIVVNCLPHSRRKLTTVVYSLKKHNNILEVDINSFTQILSGLQQRSYRPLLYSYLRSCDNGYEFISRWNLCLLYVSVQCEHLMKLCPATNTTDNCCTLFVFTFRVCLPQAYCQT